MLFCPIDIYRCGDHTSSGQHQCKNAKIIELCAKTSRKERAGYHVSEVKKPIEKSDHLSSLCFHYIIWSRHDKPVSLANKLRRRKISGQKELSLKLNEPWKHESGV